MDYDTIVEVETFIENLQNPRKKRIVRELIIDERFAIFKQELFGVNELFVRDKISRNVSKLSLFVNAKCNCG